MPATRSDVWFSRRGFVAAGGSLAILPQAQAVERVKIRDLWADKGEFSEAATKLSGQLVEMRGYMAPPLKPEATFFVLTRIPMAVCPFCDTEASWPDDLVAVEVRRAINPSAFNDLISVSGRLDIGGRTDTLTGFVSRVRLVDATFARV